MTSRFSAGQMSLVILHVQRVEPYSSMERRGAALVTRIPFCGGVNVEGMLFCLDLFSQVLSNL